MKILNGLLATLQTISPKTCHCCDCALPKGFTVPLDSAGSLTKQCLFCDEVVVSTITIRQESTLTPYQVDHIWFNDHKEQALVGNIVMVCNIDELIELREPQKLNTVSAIQDRRARKAVRQN